MKKLLLVLLILPLISFAQQGMHFEHNLSWNQILAKAKAENKYIFMDAFTTWCGPCKQMSDNIFPLEKVGTFFNKQFINVKVQLDTTANDNEEVRSWYATGHAIQEDYNIRAFPTYLYFNPDGKVVHRTIGNSDADRFIAKASNALNPEKQYYVLLDQYKAGKKDADFLRKTALASLEAYDQENIKKISKDYLATQKDPFTKENVSFIDEFTSSSDDMGFNLIKNNISKFDEVKGAGSANKKISEIIKSEEFYPLVYRMEMDKVAADWTAITKSITDKYPEFAKEVVASSKVFYYQYKADWPNFQNALLSYMKEYGAKATPDELNNYAWTVFENCKDMTCVKEALEWSKKSFKDSNNPMFIDTYANILYKLGKKDEAIQWEEKAVALSENNKTYQEVLDKMKKGEKTWKE